MAHILNIREISFALNEERAHHPHHLLSWDLNTRQSSSDGG
jgi:hypothetical protein